MPPSDGNCIYGANNELRGYEAGRYLDRFMVVTQLEYRLSLPKRFGLVGLGGWGDVVAGSWTIQEHALACRHRRWTKVRA